MASDEAAPSTTPPDSPNLPSPQNILQKIRELRLYLPLVSDLTSQKAWMYQLKEAQELLFLYEDSFTAVQLFDAKAELFYVLTEAQIPASSYRYDFMRANYESVPTKCGWRTPIPNRVELEKLENECSFIFTIKFLALNAVFGCHPRTFREQVEIITRIADECNVNTSDHLDYIYTCLNEQAYGYEFVAPQTMFLEHNCRTDGCKKTSVKNGAPRSAFLPEPGFVRPDPRIVLGNQPIYKRIQSVYQDLDAFAIQNSALFTQPGSYSGGFSIRTKHIRNWETQVAWAVSRANTAKGLRDAYLSRLPAQLSNVEHGNVLQYSQQDAQNSMGAFTQHPHGAPHDFQAQVQPSSGSQNGVQLWPQRQPHGNAGNTAQAFSATFNSRPMLSSNWQTQESQVESSPQARAHLALLRELQKDSVPDDLSTEIRAEDCGRSSS